MTTLSTQAVVYSTILHTHWHHSLTPFRIFRNLTDIINCLDMAKKDCQLDANLRDITGMIFQIKANTSTYEALCGESFLGPDEIMNSN